MARVQYFSWIKKNYPEHWRYFESMPIGGRFYDESYNFVGKKLEEIIGDKILLSGDGYSFHYGGRRFEKPDALIKYAQGLKHNPEIKKEAFVHKMDYNSVINEYGTFWTFTVHYDNRPYPNVSSGYFHSEKKAKSMAIKFLDTDDWKYISGDPDIN